MVTIVTDILVFALKSSIFLGKNDKKSSKILKSGLKNSQIHLFLTPNSVVLEPKYSRKNQKFDKKQKNSTKKVTAWFTTF